jgi:Lipoprotein LpqB beta-propeller domain
MRRRLLILALAAGLALGGCGIPDDTEVVSLGDGPATGLAAGDEVSPNRNMRADTLDKAQFIENYLEAAAGDFAGATDRVKQFLTPDMAAKFNAPPDVKVVRPVEDPLVEPGSPVVKLKVREVGTLRQKSYIEPSPDDREFEYEFTLRDLDGQQGWFVAKAPQVLLLSEEALDEFYARRTIYFWNSEHTGLVPDLRYMPLSVPSEQQPTVLLDWLVSGPSPWLAGVVDPLPEGTKPIGNVPAISDGTLQISLSDQAVPPDDPTAMDRLQKQVRWSLRPNLPGTLALSVEHQPEHRYTGTDYLAQNSAYRQIDQPERFVVYTGQVRRLARSYRADQPVPVLAPAVNRNIRMAALATAGRRTYAALVVNEAGGKQALRVGSAADGEQATLRRIGLPLPIGRPVWAKSPVGADAGTTGLIAAGGRLYSFAADGTRRQVEWPGGPGNITGVAVAPDAHRVALVAGGRLYVAALNTGADGTQLSEQYVIHTILRDVTVADWGSEGTLVVAGVRSDSRRVAIMDVSIDGASQTDRLADLGSNRVTYLATLPANPTDEETSNAVAYVLDNAAYDEVNPDRLQAGDLADPPANPPANVLPTMPLFLN